VIRGVHASVTVSFTVSNMERTALKGIQLNGISIVQYPLSCAEILNDLHSKCCPSFTQIGDRFDSHIVCRPESLWVLDLHSYCSVVRGWSSASLPPLLWLAGNRVPEASNRIPGMCARSHPLRAQSSQCRPSV